MRIRMRVALGALGCWSLTSFAADLRVAPLNHDLTELRAQIQIDAPNAAPIQLRVLKPLDENHLLTPSGFSSAALTAARLDNPGYALAQGVNQLQAPLSLLRGLLAQPLNTPPASAAVERIALPAKYRFAVPAGFSVLSEIQLAPAVAAAAWPAANLEAIHQTLTLEALPDGVYGLQAIQGDQQALSVLSIASLAVQVKQSPTQCLVRVMSRALKPVSNAQVSWRTAQGVWTTLNTPTDADGELLFDQPTGGFDWLKVQTTAARTAEQRSVWLLPKGAPNPEGTIATPQLWLGDAERLPQDGTALQLYAPTLELNAGESVPVWLTLPNQTGTTTLWSTVAGGKIFASQAHSAQGLLHAFELTAQAEYGNAVYFSVALPQAGGQFIERTWRFAVRSNARSQAALNVTTWPDAAGTTHVPLQ